jgi:hypothetical protein
VFFKKLNYGSNYMKKISGICFALFTLLLTGCAAGSATAGYSMKAQTADSLSTEAEQRIVDRAKNEVKAEMASNYKTA